jgi:hypothetical protein
MLEHLIDFEPEVGPLTDFTPLEKVGVSETVDAKASTTEWLKSIGAVDEDEVISHAQTEAARKAFSSLVSATPAEITHTALAEIKTPQAVQHLVGMLTAYDWEFVEQAKALRGYCVAKILEEVENPSANIRLKALGLLGKVTEVGLFTDKVEIKQTEMSDAEIEQRIKDKLNKFMQVVDVVDISPKDDDDES